MKIPSYAENTLSDYLEMRVDALEEVMLDLLDPDHPMANEIRESRAFFAAKVGELEGIVLQ